MITSIFFSFLASLVTLYLLLNVPFLKVAVDTPNERSMHTKVTLRTGGLGLMLGFFLPLLVSGECARWFVLVLPLIIVSLIDDIYNLDIRWRFLVHILIAILFLVSFVPDKNIFIFVMLAIGLVWVINLYNFMDGSDGLAGGMALIGFTTYAIAAHKHGDGELSIISASIAAASFAFLIFNFHPAKIFMGDSGSIPLGFLAGAIGMAGWDRNVWPIWLPILVFSPFVIDSSVTLLKRALNHEKIWKPHRTHYYQRLNQIGFGHKKTALSEYALMILVGISALFIQNSNNIFVTITLLIWALIYFILMYFIDQAWKKFEKNQ